jgi:hypothetical protein
MRALILASVLSLALAACSGKPMTPIRDFGSVSITPVENGLVTQSPLELPTTIQSLPAPTLGSVNRADN